MSVKYLQSIDPDIITRFLLLPSVGPLKKKQGSKKTDVESHLKSSSPKATKVVKTEKIKQNDVSQLELKLYLQSLGY